MLKLLTHKKAQKMIAAYDRILTGMNPENCLRFFCSVWFENQYHKKSLPSTISLFMIALIKKIEQEGWPDDMRQECIEKLNKIFYSSLI